MKKYFITFTMLFTLIISCQKDDFCIAPVTSNLVIRFYDNTDSITYKSAGALSVWANVDSLNLLYNNVSTDSIAIPLDPNKDFTVYHLKSGNIDEEITINYERSEIFVSRSCGYKYIFEDLSLSDVGNNWILNTIITNQTVENETEHIKILH